MQHPLTHPAVHHAITQAVRVVTMPQDPLESQSVKIAKDTYEATIQALHVAYIALVVGGIALFVALADAMNNTRQLAVALARPKFSVTILAEVINDSRAIAGAGTALDVVNFSYNLKNVGEKATHNYELTILFPMGLCKDLSPYRGERRDVDDVEYKVIRFGKGRQLFPFSDGQGYEVPQPVLLGTRNVTLLWKAFDDNGPSPNKNYGKVNVSIAS